MKVKTDSGVIIITVLEDLNERNGAISQLVQRILALYTEGQRRIILHLGQVTEISPRAVDLLDTLIKPKVDLTVVLCHVPRKVRDMLTTVKFNELCPIYDTEREALVGFQIPQ